MRLRWGGETLEGTYATEAASEPSSVTPITYLYEVTDSRNVRIGGERITVFLISAERYRLEGARTTRTAEERWYAPYHGDITNREGRDLLHYRSR